MKALFREVSTIATFLMLTWIFSDKALSETEVFLAIAIGHLLHVVGFDKDDKQSIK